MSVPFILPFNNNPANTSVKVSSYTIPVGKYACIVSYTPDLTINGEYVNYIRGTTVVKSGANGTTSGYFNTEGDIYVRDITLTFSGSNLISSSASFYLGNNTSPSILLSSVSRTTAGTSSGTPFLCNGNILHYSVSNGAVSSSTASLSFAWLTNSGSRCPIWIPEGTVLDGELYTVIEYNTTL